MDLKPSVIFRDETSQGERRARALLQKVAVLISNEN